MSIESITISVEPERMNMTKIDVDPIAQCESQLKSIHGDYLFTSLKPDQKIILDYTTHPVFDGFVSAYKNHRPITISPDIIWLLINQAFSNYISTDPHQFRHMFVNFKVKQNLHIKREDLNFYTMKSTDWEQMFSANVSQISKYTGEEIIETLTPNFSTTTPVSLAVGQLTIMSTMKHYFNFNFSVFGCGFPFITIEGSIDDWTKIVNKMSILEKYKFEWFTKDAIPIINKIIDTIKGNVDVEFWKQMIRIKDKNGYYDPGHVDGWFVTFFPYNKEGKRIYNSVSNDDRPQTEMQQIPFQLEIIGEETFNCVILAGFVGLTQDEKTASIKPEIGWFIKRNESLDNIFAFRNDSDDSYSKSESEDIKEEDNDYEKFNDVD